ncbi:IS21 family transposase, partial [Allorhizocola rhizosphaerae]|uniref:IS21 family transposase n=1 Tax=Allorhizocola rhizosphaerae TaxID=1872709 RepID=UPI001B8AC3D6
MLNVEDWAEIRRLYRAEQMPIKAIARKLGISKNTVRRAVRSPEPPKYVRKPAGSIVDVVEPRIRLLLNETPEMPVPVIAERIGWTRGLTVLKDRVRELRPQYRPVDPVSRTTYVPGELAQCDLWFPPADVPLGADRVARPPVLVMVCGYSRWLMARMIPSRQAHDLIGGHWALLSQLGAVPRALVWDNESAVGQWKAGKPVLAKEFQAFRGSLGIKVVLLRPRDPESKGLVERANGYLETSFLPGRSFTSPGDFNGQLGEWLGRANQRHHRLLECRPIDRLGADKAAMLALPPVAPSLGWRATTRLGRDHWVRVETCDYSVHPAAIGRRVEVVADLETVSVTCGGQLVARHARSWAPHQTITDPDHAAEAARLRRAHLSVVGRVAGRAGAEGVQQRELASYDRIFGI